MTRPLWDVVLRWDQGNLTYGQRADHLRAMLATAWEDAISHVEPYLSGETKRAATRDNPYQGGAR